MSDNKKITRIMYFLGVIPIIWLALLIAPYLNGGLIEIIKNSNNILNNPFNITIVESSMKAILIFFKQEIHYCEEFFIRIIIACIV